MLPKAADMQVSRPDYSELRLRVQHAASGAERWLHLHGAWTDTLAAPGDPINVIFRPEHNWLRGADGIAHGVFTNGTEGLLVLHPDLLLSGTAISMALRCPRQAMLQERGVGSPGKAACIGTLMHTLVQAGLAAAANGAANVATAAAGSGQPARPAPVPRGAHSILCGTVCTCLGVHRALCLYR